MNIYVGNLNFKVDENELEQIFAEYGEVSSCRIIIDKFNGRSKGFGFITMDNDDEANEAIKELAGTNHKDREMVVNEAKPRKEY